MTTENLTTRTEEAAENRAKWLSELEKIGDDDGYFESLGNRHWALFIDDSPTLIVTFESVQGIRDRDDDELPLGLEIARANGWSHLCLIADGQTWYRDPAVYGYFDRLVDDAFFEDFDNVVFYGAGMGAYAAAAYSVTAPGATVLALHPCATLDPRVTEWDYRHQSLRRLDFTSRYGYAPDMIEGAGEVFVFYDPEQQLDAMHAALFTKPFVQKIRCRHLGANLETAFDQMDILFPLIRDAATGMLDSRRANKTLRARRENGHYLRRLLGRLEADDRLYLAALLCRNVSSRMRAPGFRKKHRELAELLAKDGISLPEA